MSKNIIQDSATFGEKYCTFIIFKSIDNIFYIIYGSNRRSIIFYNLLNNKKMAAIKDAHLSYINYFRHIFDEKNKRDLILSQFSGVQETNLKIWNVSSLESILNFQERLFGNIESCF